MKDAPKEVWIDPECGEWGVSQWEVPDNGVKYLLAGPVEKEIADLKAKAAKKWADDLLEAKELVREIDQLKAQIEVLSNVPCEVNVCDVVSENRRLRAENTSLKNTILSGIQGDHCALCREIKGGEE